MSEGHYSCDFLEWGITFAPRSLHACCIVHHRVKGWVALCDYNGGELPEAAIRKARAEIKGRLNDGNGEPKCEGCIYLKRKNWETPKYLIQHVGFQHFTHCNLHCDYCFLEFPRKNKLKPGSTPYSADPRFAQWWYDWKAALGPGGKPYDVLPVVESMIEKRQLAPDARVWWGGGEPTLLKDFDRIVDRLVAHGTRQEISSNATVFSPVILKHLSQKSNIGLTVSVDAGTRASYSKVKGRDAFDTVCANLNTYSAGGGNDVLLKIIVTEDNATETNVAGVMDMLRRTGIRKLRIDLDNYAPTQSEAVVNTMASLKCEAERLQVKADAYGTGMDGMPELNIQERIARRVGQAKEATGCCSSNGGPPAAPAVVRPALFNATARKPVAVAPEAPTPAPVFARAQAKTPVA